MTNTDREALDAEVRAHPDFEPTRRRWYSVCLAAGRDPTTAAERADNYAYGFIARQIARREYLGQRRVGPPPIGGEVRE